MGYLHIDNLYKNTDIQYFRECYALEKIHGTSANIKWDGTNISFFSGGEKHSNFVKLFDSEKLKSLFKELYYINKIVIYGEAYGGKQQGMSSTYGKELKFVAFDVKINDMWLNVPNAHDVAEKLGIEFVSYNKIPTDTESLNKEKELPSVQAKRNGISEDKTKEGIVLRPLIELNKNNCDRIISKHKNDKFMETRTKREIDPERLKVLENAKEIAKEWVTEMRMSHVLDKLKNPDDMSEVSKVIKAMLEDIKREAKGEIIDSKEARKAISSNTVAMYKNRISILKNKK